jgi:hypothetical protein
MNKPKNDFFSDGYGKNDLINDLEYLYNVGLVDIVGIDDEGEWLYGLSEMARRAIDESGTSDPNLVLSKLLREAREKNA